MSLFGEKKCNFIFLVGGVPWAFVNVIEKCETQLLVLLKMYETLGEVICAEFIPVTLVSEFRQRIRGSALLNSVCSAFQAKGNS